MFVFLGLPIYSNLKMDLSTNFSISTPAARFNFFSFLLKFQTLILSVSLSHQFEFAGLLLQFLLEARSLLPVVVLQFFLFDDILPSLHLLLQFRLAVEYVHPTETSYKLHSFPVFFKVTFKGIQSYSIKSKSNAIHITKLKQTHLFQILVAR